MEEENVEIILLIIAICLIRRHSKKKKLARMSDPNYVKNERELKKDESDFRVALSHAAELIGPNTVRYRIPKVAHCYGTGTGVAQDLSEAVKWKSRELEEAYRFKAELNKTIGIYAFDPEQIVDFFIDGVSYPRDAALAKVFAVRLLQMEEPRSALILEKIDALISMGFFQIANDMKSTTEFLQKKSDEGNDWATYQLALYWKRLDFNGSYPNYTYVELEKKARRAGNVAAICRGSSPAVESAADKRALDIALSQMDKKYKYMRALYLLGVADELIVHKKYAEQWDAAAEHAGVAGDTAKTICWFLKEIGWPQPNQYKPVAVRSDMIDAYQRARIDEVAGKDFSHVAYLYRPLAEAGHPESMRRLGNIMTYVLSNKEHMSDDQYKEGLSWQRKAAAAGDLFAMQDLGQNVDPASLAALAVCGNFEALMRLGMQIELGKGGPANPLAAHYIYTLCWDAMGTKAAELNNEQLMLKCRLIRCMDGLRGVYSDKYLSYLANAEKRGYTPAEYLLLLHPNFGRKYGHKNERELAQAALSGGFAKAQHVINYLKNMEKEWEDYTAYKYQNDTVKSTKDANLYLAMLKAKGFPDKYNMLYRGEVPSPEITIKDAEELNKQANGQEPEGNIRDMPHFITDDMGRTWEFDMIYFDSARYVLSRGYSETVVEDYLGKDVYISNHHIHGNTAKTPLHSFYW